MAEPGRPTDSERPLYGNSLDYGAHMLAATLGYSLVFGVLNGLWWVMVLRGPYWLYRRRGHRDAGKFWTPWGLTIAGVIAVISTFVTLAGNY